MTDFAQRHMAKCGWTEGSGLGRSESGIRSALKVKLKNNTNGLGHDTGSEFSFHWWDHIFNKAASSFTVNETEDGGVKIEKCEAKKQTPLLISNKRGAVNRVHDENLLYGTFVKAGTYDASKVQTPTSCPDTVSSEDSSSSEEEDEEVGSGEVINSTLEKMYKRTGLTGHKAARHGHSLNGKLQRLMDQESNAASSTTTSSTSTTSTDASSSTTSSSSSTSSASSSSSTTSKTSSKSSSSISSSVLSRLPQLSSYTKLEEVVVDGTGNSCNEQDTKEGVVVETSESKKKKKKKKKKMKSSYSQLDNSSGSSLASDTTTTTTTDAPTQLEKKVKKTVADDTSLADNVNVQTEHNPTTEKRKKKKKKKTSSVCVEPNTTPASTVHTFTETACELGNNIVDLACKMSSSVSDLTSKVSTSVSDAGTKLKKKSRKHKLLTTSLSLLDEQEDEPEKKRKKKKKKND